MKLKYKILFSIMLIALFLPALAHAFQLVPCGGSGQPVCTWEDLTKALIRVINLLLAASGIVALYYIFMAAWSMISAMGNPEKITGGKEGLIRAIIGFTIIIISFAFINLLLAILGIEGCSWWTGNFACLWGGL